MKVKGSANPGKLPRIEDAVGKPDYIDVRFAENIVDVSTEIESLWEYDEYLITVPTVNRADIEANPARWMEIAKDYEAEQLASRQQRERDEHIAADLPAVASIAFVAMAETGQLDNVTITEHPTQFVTWDENWRGKAGNIVQDEGKLYRSIHDVTDAGQNRKPSETPSMWTRIGNPADEWPEWSKPIGSHDAYGLNAKVTHNDNHWISAYAANVWEPSVFGWTKQN